MRRARALAALAAALLGAAAAQTLPPGLPARELTVTAAQLSSVDFLDTAPLATKKAPLEDAFLDTPELLVACGPPWAAPPLAAPQQAHLAGVAVPLLWYFPSNWSLGAWPYESGDVLRCAIWECDGAAGGCDPRVRGTPPSAATGDDLLGEATLSLGAFQLFGTTVLNFTAPAAGTAGGRGTPGAEAAVVVVECPGCRQLWRQYPSWVNPYGAPAASPAPAAFPAPAASPAPAAALSPLPPAAAAVPSPAPAPAPSSPFVGLPPEIAARLSPPGTGESPTFAALPPPAPAVQQFDGAAPPAAEPAAPSPLASPSPPPSSAALPLPPVSTLPPPSPPATPSPSPPPAPVVEQPEVAVRVRSGARATLTIVLAVLGALVGATLLVALLVLCWSRCRWRAVAPTAAAAPAPRKGGDDAPDAAPRALRIRVQRPADAEAALRHHRADGALAEIPEPWAPRTG